jgi:hypothetical protein
MLEGEEAAMLEGEEAAMLEGEETACHQVEPHMAFRIYHDIQDIS